MGKEGSVATVGGGSTDGFGLVETAGSGLTIAGKGGNWREGRVGTKGNVGSGLKRGLGSCTFGEDAHGTACRGSLGRMPGKVGIAGSPPDSPPGNGMVCNKLRASVLVTVRSKANAVNNILQNKVEEAMAET